MSTFFAIFDINNAYLASRDAEFLQRALDLLVSLFERVGLETNTSKMQTMICTPANFRLTHTGDCNVAVSQPLSGTRGTSSAPSVGK